MRNHFVALVVGTLFYISCTTPSEPFRIFRAPTGRSARLLPVRWQRGYLSGPVVSSWSSWTSMKIKLWCRMNLSPPEVEGESVYSGMLPNKPQSLNEIPRSFRVWANFPTISNPALALPRAPSPVGSNKGWPSRICAQRSRAALKFSSGQARNSGVGWGKSTGHQPWFNLINGVYLCVFNHWTMVFCQYEILHPMLGFWDENKEKLEGLEGSVWNGV